MDKGKILIDVFKSYDNYLAKKSAPPQKLNIEEIISFFFCPGPFYYYILDSPTLTFENVSPQAKKILGIDLEGLPVGVMVDRVHPDDFDYFLNCESFVADFFKNKITPEQYVKYKISYCLREKTKDGTYKLFLMQNITLANTEDGALLKVLGVHSDISHITSVNNYKLSLFGLDGEPSYLAIDILNKDSDLDKQNKNIFSKRELDVIRLLAEGFTAKEAAQKLFISFETVISHKKNAFIKSGCRNSIQLISYCLKQGLI